MMTIRNCTTLAILSVLLWAPAASAAPPPGAEDNDVEQLRAKVREQVRGMAIRRTAQMLGLDAAASGRLGTVVVRYDDQIYALRRENMKARRELVQLVKAGQPADARINQLVDQLTAGRVRIVHLAEERAKEVRRLLTPLQFGKLIAMGPLV